MVLRWKSWRCTSLLKPLIAILLVSVVATSLAALFIPHSLRLQRISAEEPFGINVNLDFGFGEVFKSIPHWISPGSASAQSSLGTHTLTPDGLLIVNPDGPHPIFQLMRDAEAAWEAKNARASRTLGEAVAEYRRRYHRPPPLGFDKWWEYVVKHNVLLPDEYDEIFEDIEPFWGIDPRALAHTQQELEKQDSVVTFEKAGAHSEFNVVHSTLEAKHNGNLPGTINSILTLIRVIEQDLPPLRFSMSSNDNPNKLSDWKIIHMTREAAANGTSFMNADLPVVSKAGWIQACSPDSPARLNPNVSLSRSATPPPPPLSPKTFIASHREAMDPCLHPWLLSTHGQFVSHIAGPYPQKTLVPRFSLCSTLVHHDIRPPVPYGWDWETDREHEDGAFREDLPWERKTEEKLNWRGRTTGIYASPQSLWKLGHRTRLVALTNALEGNVDVLGVPENSEVPIGDPKLLPLAEANSAWMDIAFAGEAVQCDRDAGTCDEMEELLTFQGNQGKAKEGQQKFILDVDGNGWSGRFKRLITSNALVFKATIYPEWYMSRIAPWVHYVPIQLSYTDLYDAMAFFRVHDELAAKIAKAGRAWSRQFWRQEDMTAYLYRLLLEYARVSSLDRASMNYVG